MTKAKSPARAANPATRTPHSTPSAADRKAGRYGQPPARDPGRRASFREAGRVLSLYTLSAVLLAWIFPGHLSAAGLRLPGFWPLAFVAFVPWALATIRTQTAWLVHWLSFLVGWGFFLVALRWLEPVTGLGYAALAFYLAVYWTLAGWAIRTGRRHGISIVWTLPVAWVACEYLRAVVMTGFPWLFVAHGFYAQLPLIQICDITGAYGVSFLVALVNGVLVEALLRRWPVTGPGPARCPRQFVAGVIAVVVLLAATLAYGYYRLGEVDFERDPARQGPRVAVIQESFPLYSKPPYAREHEYMILARYLQLAAEAARQKPDLVAFPETAWNAYQNIEYIESDQMVPDARPALRPFSLACHEAIAAFARGDYPAVNAVLSDLESQLRFQARVQPELDLPESLPRLPSEGGPPVTTLVGAVSIVQFPESTYPKVRYFNSALVYDPDGTQRRTRYDKVHLVPFGELVPFRQAKFLGLDLHWLYRWLNKLSPFSAGGRFEYSLTPGDEFTVFELATAAGVRRFGVPICYEDATPYVVRNFVWDGPRRRVDFLVNISNDAWFLYSNELPQHLAICAFRAVENRVGIARAVNTGISGFIDPNGRIRSVVEQEGRRVGPGIVGYDLEPVFLDDRASFYGRHGDLFAQLCLIGAGILWLSAIFERWVLQLRQRIVMLLGKGES